MTEKQRRFADMLLAGSEAAEAYRAAYPNCRHEQTARTCARRLLESEAVRGYLRQRAQAQEDADREPGAETEEPREVRDGGAAVADGQEILTMLTAMMRGQVTVADGRKAPDDRMRMKAAELLGRILGLFSEKGVAEDETAVIIDDAGEETGGE